MSQVFLRASQGVSFVRTFTFHLFFRWKVFQVRFHGISGTFHFKNVKTGKLTEEGRLIL